MTTSIERTTIREGSTPDGDVDPVRLPRQRTALSRSWALDDDDVELEVSQVPDVDPSILLVDGELTMPVVPVRADEFTCGSCFLIYHRSQLTRTGGGRPVCQDCAGSRPDRASWARPVRALK